MLMFRWQIFLDDQTNFGPERITAAAWLLGALFFLVDVPDRGLSGC